MRVEISIRLSGKLISTTRYGNVFYLTGGEATRFGKCEAADPSCWNMTRWFYAGLPNGDIAMAYIDPAALLRERIGASAPGMAVGAPFHLKGEFAGILREQPENEKARIFGPCMRLDDPALTREYGIAPKEAGTSDDYVDVTLTRIEAEEAPVMDNLWVEVHLKKLHCSAIWTGTAQGVVITPISAP